MGTQTNMNIRNISNISNISIGTKLGFGFAVIVMSLIGLFNAALSMVSLNQSLTRTTEEEWVKRELAQAVSRGARDIAVRNLDLLIATSAERRADIQQHIDANKANITKALNRLDTLVRLPEDKAALAKTKEARARYVESLGHIAALVEKGDRAEAARIMNDETLVVLDAFLNAVAQLATLHIELPATNCRATA